MNKTMFKDLVYMRMSYTGIQTPVKFDYIIYYQDYEIVCIIFISMQRYKKRDKQTNKFRFFNITKTIDTIDFQYFKEKKCISYRINIYFTNRF